MRAQELRFIVKIKNACSTEGQRQKALCLCSCVGWHWRYQKVRKTFRRSGGRKGGGEVDEWRWETRGMEWDRKWKPFSGFTPSDLISVIMGFMSFPSRRPHTTSHVPGHTHTHTHRLRSARVFHSLAQRQTLVHVFLSPGAFLTLPPSTVHMLHLTRDPHRSRRLVHGCALLSHKNIFNQAKIIKCMIGVTFTYPTARHLGATRCPEGRGWWHVTSGAHEGEWCMKTVCIYHDWILDVEIVASWNQRTRFLPSEIFP